jgi:ABC-2 type transport system ATP-binding protein
MSVAARRDDRAKWAAGSEPPPALRIEGLRKAYQRGTVAVEGLSFSVERGEFFGLIGPNGAGKSTTIHCVTGICQITAGRIEVCGHDVEVDYREARRRIGFSPQGLR